MNNAQTKTSTIVTPLGQMPIPTPRTILFYSTLTLHVEREGESRISQIADKTPSPLLHLTVGKEDGWFSIKDLGAHSIPVHELRTYLGSTKTRNILVERFLPGYEGISTVGIEVRSRTIGTLERDVCLCVVLGDTDILEALTDDMFFE